MGLSGTLEAFPLSEVLRLLGRSGQTGRLFARSGEKEMRAYLQAGQLVVAWAGSDEALGDELIGRGLIDQLDWDDVASGAVACEQALHDGVSALDFDHAILDITIEGLAKMVDGREGTFAFEEGEVSDLRLETEIELDAVLEGVEDRLTTWRRLRAIVPDTTQPLEFLRVTAGSEVTLSDRAWNLLVQMLPRATLDDLILESGRTSTAFVEDLLELLTDDLASIEGFTAPDEVDSALKAAEADDEGDDAPSIVPDDPLAGAGPTGWENELASIAATDSADDEDEDDHQIPLLEGEAAEFLNSAKEADGFDFGLVGIDLGPVKGRNLLEKDDSWTGILGGDAAATQDEPDDQDESEPQVADEPAPAPLIDLGLDGNAHDDDLLGSVLNRLDEVLADGDEPGDTDVTPDGDSGVADLPVYAPTGELVEPSNDWDPHAERDDAGDDETDEFGQDGDHDADGLPGEEMSEPEEIEASWDEEDTPEVVEEDELMAAVAALEEEIEASSDEEDRPEVVEEDELMAAVAALEEEIEASSDEEDTPEVVEEDELMAVVAALEDEVESESEVDADDESESLDIEESLQDDEPQLLERVAELLGDDEGDLPGADEVVPYDADVADDAEEAEDATANADPDEPHPADDPAPGMSNLLRRRARGALAKELRSLSD